MSPRQIGVVLAVAAAVAALPAAAARWYWAAVMTDACCAASRSAARARAIGVWVRDVPVTSPPLVWAGDTLRVREAWVEHEYGESVGFWGGRTLRPRSALRLAFTLAGERPGRELLLHGGALAYGDSAEGWGVHGGTWEQRVPGPLPASLHVRLCRAVPELDDAGWTRGLADCPR